MIPNSDFVFLVSFVFTIISAFTVSVILDLKMRPLLKLLISCCAAVIITTGVLWSWGALDDVVIDLLARVIAQVWRWIDYGGWHRVAVFVLVWLSITGAKWHYEKLTSWIKRGVDDEGNN